MVAVPQCGQCLNISFRGHTLSHFYSLSERCGGRTQKGPKISVTLNGSNFELPESINRTISFFSMCRIFTVSFKDISLCTQIICTKLFCFAKFCTSVFWGRLVLEGLCQGKWNIRSFVWSLTKLRKIVSISCDVVRGVFL